MPGILDNTLIDIPCERCGRKTKKRIGWIKRHREFTCRCGAQIVLDADQVVREIARVEHNLASLNRVFEQLGK